jgi:hypothetical protein
LWAGEQEHGDSKLCGREDNEEHTGGRRVQQGGPTGQVLGYDGGVDRSAAEKPGSQKQA